MRDLRAVVVMTRHVERVGVTAPASLRAPLPDVAGEASPDDAIAHQLVAEMGECTSRVGGLIPVEWLGSLPLQPADLFARTDQVATPVTTDHHRHGWMPHCCTINDAGTRPILR